MSFNFQDHKKKPLKYKRFQLPADWEPHAKTVIALPDHLQPRISTGLSVVQMDVTTLEDEVLHIFERISKFEKVDILVNKNLSSRNPRLLLPFSSNQRVREIHDHSDRGISMEIRYTAPTVLNEVLKEEHRKPGQVAISMKQPFASFNGRNLYRPKEDRPCHTFAWNYIKQVSPSLRKYDFQNLAITWDNSAFVHDGSGTFIVSTAMLRMWPQAEAPFEAVAGYIEQNMRAYMGAHYFIWIEKAYKNDDRPLSSMVRFVGKGEVLLSKPPTFDGSCPWVEFYTIIYGTLRSCKDQYQCKMFRIIELRRLILPKSSKALRAT